MVKKQTKPRQSTELSKTYYIYFVQITFYRENIFTTYLEIRKKIFRFRIIVSVFWEKPVVTVDHPLPPFNLRNTCIPVSAKSLIFDSEPL